MMFPVYKDMNSYPYQANPMPSARYYHPSWESPPQKKEDPSSSSCSHESWPHNYGYAVPMQCHNCCTHGQHPSYYNFRPPCSHFPPPPPPAYHHYYGSYPPYPQPYPMYYGPPPHYPMDLPRYECDKGVPRDQFHCCGCLNYPSHVKGGNNVKIEEHEPDAEAKKSEPLTSLFPARANNFPYPIMWIPPEYALNKEQPKRLVESEENQQPEVKKSQVQQRPGEINAQENEGTPLGTKPHQSVRSIEQDPDLRSGWLPLDINKIKRLMEGGDAKQTRGQEIRNQDEKKAPDEENKDQNKHPFYPIFWYPNNGRKEDSLKGQLENTAGGTATEGSPCNVLPEKIERADNETEKQSSTGGDNGRIRAGADKKKIVKTIPVKQLEESAPELSKKVEEHKQDTSRNSTSVQSSSSTKKPKLPPVCLKIDPPKKKKGNGSLSSSGNKQQDSKSSSEKMSEQPQKETKIKDAVEKTPCLNKIEVSRDAEEDKKGSEIVKDKAVDSEKMVVHQTDSDKSEDVKSGDYRGEAQEPKSVKESEFLQESRQEQKVISEMEAAVVIQAAYRGHVVRRSEPMKKLKEIAKVHEEAIQVKKQLDDLESRAPVDVKEKTAIGETIMNLLLKLDTMQGLHQSIRDFRKSVTKELINLHEKLDCITSEQSVVLAQDTSTTQDVEEPPKDNSLVEGSEATIESAGQPIEDLSLDGDKNTEGETFSSIDLSSSQPLPCQGVSASENREISEASSVNIESKSKSSDNIMVSSARSDGGVAPAILGLNMKESDESETAQEKSPTDLQKSTLANTSPVEDTAARNDLVLDNKNEEVNLVYELPQEAVDISVENDLLHKNNEQEKIWYQDYLKMSMRIAGNGKEDHKVDILHEPSQDVEEGGVDVKLTGCDLEHSKSAFPSKEQSHAHEGSVSASASASIIENKEEEEGLLINLPPEVNNDDGKDLTEVETSQNLNKELDELPVETLVPERDAEESKEEDGAWRRSLEGQSSVVTHAMDEQMDKKLIEENEKLKTMLEKLLSAGKEQEEVISSLNGKVKDLEKKKLGSKKKMKSAKHPRVRISRRLHGNSANNTPREMKLLPERKNLMGSEH
ncbi:BAG family molecular chaperone regulator 6 [Bienertia sinuspersici]